MRAALGAGRERLAAPAADREPAARGGGGAARRRCSRSRPLPLVARLVPNALPIAETPPLDLRILAFAALMTARHRRRLRPRPGAAQPARDAGAVGLREGARAGGSGRRSGCAPLLVVAEVTASVVLLVASGLLLRALCASRRSTPASRPRAVLTLRTTLPLPKYEPIAAARHSARASSPRCGRCPASRAPPTSASCRW